MAEFHEIDSPQAAADLDVLAAYAAPGTIVIANVAMALANNGYEIPIVAGVKRLIVCLGDLTVAWWWAKTQQVASDHAAAGLWQPIAAGGYLELEGPFDAQSIWIASATVSMNAKVVTQ